MPTDHFAPLFPAACAGLGLFLAGAVNLILRRWRLSVRLVATLVAVSVGLACASSLDQPGVVAGTARLLAVGLLVLFLLASRRCINAVSAVLTCLHRPVVCYSLLTVGGIGLLLGALATFEKADRVATDAMMSELEWMDHVPTVPSNRATATTDQGNAITLKEPSTVREGIDWNGAEDRTLKGAHLDGQVIRRGGATEKSNCHGWVFAGGKFNISGEAVEAILKENGYTETHEPQPGDLTIYRQGGGITHSAIVRYVTEGQPVIVEGKWGSLGVFLHPADKSTYGSDYTFYRSARHGHLLSGLGGSNPNPAAAPAAATTE
jgi:hypothetical protein